MIAVGHTSVGVMVGLAGARILPEVIPLSISIPLILIVGIISHYSMDLLPHGHYDFDGGQPTRRSVAVLCMDLALPILAFSLIIWLKFGMEANFWLVLAGIAGAQLPDVFDGLLAARVIPQWRWALAEHQFHLGTHWHNPTEPQLATPQGGRRLNWSDLWQAVVALTAIAWLIRY